VKAPELVHWSRPGLARHASANRAIVFVHGIFSDHNTFEACYDTFVEDVRFNDFEFFYYDYDYNDSLENNGKLLAKILTKRFGPDDQVVIIAHSMGGLVARIAIVSERMLFVREPQTSVQYGWHKCRCSPSWCSERCRLHLRFFPEKKELLILLAQVKFWNRIATSPTMRIMWITSRFRVCIFTRGVPTGSLEEMWRQKSLRCFNWD
jgi:Putative serine esterase (DUF676)